MKDLLVHVDDTPEGAARVASAMALAKAFDARLTGLHVEADPEVAPGTAVGRLNRTVELIASSNASIARRSHEVFVSALRSSNLRHEWLSAKGDVTQNIVGWSR